MTTDHSEEPLRLLKITVEIKNKARSSVTSTSATSPPEGKPRTHDSQATDQTSEPSREARRSPDEPTC